MILLRLLDCPIDLTRCLSPSSWDESHAQYHDIREVNDGRVDEGTDGRSSEDREGEEPIKFGADARAHAIELS